MSCLKYNGSRASFLVTVVLIAALLFPTVCYAATPILLYSCSAQNIVRGTEPWLASHADEMPRFVRSAKSSSVSSILQSP
uniref:Uncharacterized protein n=1 Tax=Oryza punctata TaxID=4537 RepID=A0A0E0LN20_ORYPU